MMAMSGDHVSETLATGGIGHVTSIVGSNVSFDLEGTNEPAQERVTVGSVIGVRADRAYLVGVIKAVSADRAASGDSRPASRADLDLLGEIHVDRGERSFKRGVASYPAIADVVERLSTDDLSLVHRSGSAKSVEVGCLYHDPSMPATIKVDGLLSKHFAVLGSTGVGKSSGVAVIVDSVLHARPDVRVFMLDVHNEYTRCFGERANVISPRAFKLPFWMFNIEELADVIYGGRAAVDEEIEVLIELIPLAKVKYAQYKELADRSVIKRTLGKPSGYTVDTPVPYLLQDLLSLIDERMGRLENRIARIHFHRLITRIEAIRNDPRYGFMFENANVGGDVMGALLSHLFRLEPNGKPITVMQLAGLPTEVLDAVVCVLCRLAFEFGVWSEAAVPLLFVCEEAHRYASADHSVGFSPTRRALSRIAREGRKHGVHLGLVTQRPAELDPTIISQCSTLFAMRMSNERDQAFLRSAVSDAANLLTFAPLLGTGEAIAFGEGVSLPTRMRFRELAPERLPRTDTSGRMGSERGGDLDSAFVGVVVERWRGATMNKGTVEPAEPAGARVSREPGSDTSTTTAIEQAHRRLLKLASESSGSTTAEPPAFRNVFGQAR